MKNKLLVYLINIIAGIVFISIALLSETKIEGFLWGMSGATIVPGLLGIYNYLKYKRPENKKEYEKIQKKSKIEREDERNIYLRDKSGRFSYTVGIHVNLILLIVFEVLMMLGYENIKTKYILILFFILLLLQVLVGIVVYNFYKKRV